MLLNNMRHIPHSVNDENLTLSVSTEQFVIKAIWQLYERIQAVTGSFQVISKINTCEDGVKLLLQLHL